MRAHRLGEFVAHEGAVNCVRIGRDTAGVLVTGGEDKKVNLWRTGQTGVVKSLSGLQSPVECVVFDEKEDTIAAGGANGTVKVWDMDSGKVSRSLTGHRANCLSLAFTTSDTNFLVSGSLDCSVKVWDLRRKEAIVTFRGHHTGVLKVATSPDNKWVCSGSDDGEIKIWDIQTGRLIKDKGWGHTGRITGLEFNQLEFMMVSSGADKKVRVWDLESWEQIDCLGPEATPVQAISYATDGGILLTATADALKVWTLEPTVHHDTVPTDWRNLADLQLCYKDGNPRALGCCCNGGSVGLFMVDLRKVAPFCNAALDAAAVEAAAPQGNGAGGAQQLQQQQQPRPQSGSRPAAIPAAAGAAGVLQEYLRAGPQQQQQQQPYAPSDAGTEGDTVDRPQGFLSLMCEAAVAGSPNEQAAAAGPLSAGPLTRQLTRQRTPPRPAGGLIGSNSSSSKQLGGAFLQSPTAKRAGQLQLSPTNLAAQYSPAQQQQQQPKGSDYFPEVEIRVPAARPSPPVVHEQAARGAAAAAAVGNGERVLLPSSTSSRRGAGLELGVAAAQLAAGMADASLQEPHVAGWQQQQPQQQLGISRSSSSKQQEQASPGALHATLAVWLQERGPVAAEASSPAQSKSTSRNSSMPVSRVSSRPDMTSSLQQQQHQRATAAPAAAGAPGGGDPVLSAMAARPQLKLELSRMMSALQVAKGFAARGNLEGAYKAVVSQGDAAVACMLLEAVSSRADAFELSSLEPLIKLLELLLASGQEQQLLVGLNVLGLVLRGPGQTVYEVCSAPKPVGVDLSFETRHSKCLLLKMALEGLGMKLGVLSRGQGQLGTRALLLAEELKRIVSAGGGS